MSPLVNEAATNLRIVEATPGKYSLLRGKETTLKAER